MFYDQTMMIFMAITLRDRDIIIAATLFFTVCFKNVKDLKSVYYSQMVQMADIINFIECLILCNCIAMLAALFNNFLLL